ncbi:hypothetical protein [Streptomyces guryensis]|uniref:Uncharacterized protein n=1 Tax=Streptomyces guryensis TaxID=2886947 RepID=A0A9Q3W1F4_9ACTN|nr:hypothetical protein [Streptomyces guryensis]MCD9880855.1 hypothetical protein [Streptomyces guryensis]
MNDEDTPGAGDGEEDGGQEAEPQQDSSTHADLSGFMESVSQTAAWLNSIDKMLEPVRRHIRDLKSTRRAIDSVMGPGNALYQAALDARRQCQA